MEINFYGHILFLENIQISNFVKIRPVWAEFFLADWELDRQTDTTKLIVAFRHFAQEPKNVPFVLKSTISV